MAKLCASLQFFDLGASVCPLAESALKISNVVCNSCRCLFMILTRNNHSPPRTAQPTLSVPPKGVCAPLQAQNEAEIFAKTNFERRKNKAKMF